MSALAPPSHLPGGIVNHSSPGPEDKTQLPGLSLSGTLRFQFLGFDPLDKPNILNRQYESTFTQEDETNILHSGGQPYPQMSDKALSRDGILKQLKKINHDKALGPDMILAKIILRMTFFNIDKKNKISEYDQEIPQSHTVY